MPLIEELPTAKGNTTTPGWAYVPDTGYDPSKAPIVPSGSRNRKARNATTASGNEISARQQHKIDQHLASLDRENHKDVQIVIPNRPRDVVSRGLHGHMTPGVKKILLSQKTFANHLADEEAAIALREEEATSRSAARPAAAKTKRSSLAQQATPTDVEMSDALDQGTEVDAHNSGPTSHEEEEEEEHPLLRINAPPMPTEEEINALINSEPLSYNAARAAPSTSTAPRRQFCEICGYWGRVRCMKCGVRVCGLECQRQHDETNCQKFWA